MNSTVSRIFSDDTIKVFILLLSLIMSESCIRKKFHPGDYADSQESYLDSDKTRDFGDGIGFELFHPDQARVTLSVAEVKAQDFGKDFPLPGFDIQQNRNDYVMILRCQESYRISFLEELSAVETSGHKKGQWLWLDSLGNPSLCKIASRRLNGTRFEDMGASDGSFFYVVNPCVSEGLSSTGADGCSYLLAVSNTVSYRNSPGSQFLRISAELADAESAYDAVMSRLLGLSKRLMNSKSSCEFAINRQESQENVRK
ncbi:MAG: hypothetical protein H6618_08345, partial [Deltaproteobacteria bacterium]|nr:hypothetical protein [Deltaproteobacteria bacterium]